MAEGEAKGTMRVACIGDIHVKEEHQAPYRELFGEISREADVLVLAGDLTDLGKPREAEILAEDLRACSIPVVGVLGNHDYECGCVEEVSRILRGAGVRLLDGTSCEIEGVGFVGVLIMLSPYLRIETFTGSLRGGPTLGAFCALLGAFCSAGAMIQVRRLTATETTGAIVFYFFILASTLSLCTLPFGWHRPDAADLGLFAVSGILGGIGQILVTQSYRHADTSVIAPFEYTTMIWALLFGWFVFGDLPTAAMLTGAAIVAATGVFIVWREHRLGMMRSKELQASSQKSGV